MTHTFDAIIDDVILHNNTYYIVTSKIKINGNCWLNLLNIKDGTYYGIQNNEAYYILTEQEIKQKFPFLT